MLSLSIFDLPLSPICQFPLPVFGIKTYEFLLLIYDLLLNIFFSGSNRDSMILPFSSSRAKEKCTLSPRRQHSAKGGEQFLLILANELLLFKGKQMPINIRCLEPTVT
jgi:hypothetical protein